MASSIEWLNGGETWNPIRARLKDGHPVKAAVPQHKVGWACVRISPGCENCYSEKQNMQCGTNKTRAGTGLNYTVPALQMVDLFLDEDTLMQPLHWKKPRLIFPCSMTDWMADFVPDEWRDKMLAVMALTPQHTYLTLTKRADRQQEYMSDQNTRQRVAIAMLDIVLKIKPRSMAIPIEHRPDSSEAEPRFWSIWPISNLWLGTSAEDQQRADERIPQLLQTPAAVRWVSAEPLLEAIELNKVRHPLAFGASVLEGIYKAEGNNYCSDRIINWIVVGGESGSGARKFNIEWARQIIEQCQSARVPVFVKQLGSKPYLHSQKSLHIDKPGMKLSMQSLEIKSTLELKHPKGGDISEWPKDLRVREYPKVKEAKHASA